MRSARPAFGCCFALLCSLGGCLSGQTGSPDCVPAMSSCICEPLYGAGTPLRVHVDHVQADKLEAVVDEVLPTVFPSTIVPGDRIGGSVVAELPCASVAVSSLQDGRELFVLYSPSSTQGHVTLSDGLINWAVPWDETLRFGGSFELSSSELSVLSSIESCEERFPGEPAPPCDDTGACSAAPHAPGFGYGPALLGLAALLGVLRRQRQTSSSQQAIRRASCIEATDETCGH